MNQNFIQEEIKSRLKSGNACYHSVHNLLSSSLLSKNIKMKIYRTIILPVVLYGCETWLLTLRVKHKLKVFENRVLRRMFGTERDKVTGKWGSLMICTPDQIIQAIKSRRMRWVGHVACMRERRGVYRVLVGKPEGKRPQV